jgi:hypothetical protein
MTSLMVFTVAAATSIAAQQPAGRGNEPRPDPSTFNPQPPRESRSYFPPIVNATFIRPAEVTDQVLPEELVLGTVIGGEARAYPLNMLTGPTREIINDRLGGRAIAATW